MFVRISFASSYKKKCILIILWNPFNAAIIFLTTSILSLFYFFCKIKIFYSKKRELEKQNKTANFTKKVACLEILLILKNNVGNFQGRFLRSLNLHQFQYNTTCTKISNCINFFKIMFSDLLQKFHWIMGWLGSIPYKLIMMRTTWQSK